MSRWDDDTINCGVVLLAMTAAALLGTAIGALSAAGVIA